ncbi:hypothetical protein PTKIN_Ptkin11bG0029500 [Pterospermum kingtungense]
MPIQQSLIVNLPTYDANLTEPLSSDIFYGVELPTISGIANEAEILSSLQRPKKIVLLGSDSIERLLAWWSGCLILEGSIIFFKTYITHGKFDRQKTNPQIKRIYDQCQGDSVRIDFSCLFDKGLQLEKPELVPFRLTQIMIDGLGITGCEGIFLRICEIALSVLRTHRETLMSVLETFILCSGQILTNPVEYKFRTPMHSVP